MRHSGAVRPPSNPFVVLGLPATASEAEIKGAYRTASRKVHPDAGGDPEAFRELTKAYDQAMEFATGAMPNPYLVAPSVLAHDRHRHTPPPPPNPWRNGVLGGSLFWILPVLAGIFMISSSTGPYFVPVFLAGTALLAVAVWVVLRRTSRR